MTKIMTRSNLPGSVIVKETFPDIGYCRSAVTVTTKAGMDVGAVLKLDTGKYVWCAAADVASAVAVLVDDNIDMTTAGDQTLVVFDDGPAVVSRGGLKFDGAVTDANIDAAAAALAAKGIKVIKGVTRYSE